MDGRTDGTCIYIYVCIRRIFHSSTISVGLVQAHPNNFVLIMVAVVVPRLFVNVNCI